MSRSKKGGGGSRRVVKRDARERKDVPKHLERFASGDDDALWRRTQRNRLKDPRQVMLVPGVANRDARAVYQARERRLRAASEAGDEAALALELRDAARLRLWRANSLVSWEAFVENVLELSLERAAPIVEGVEPENDEAVATWMRAEAGLLEAHDGCVRLEGEALSIEVPLERAPAALAAMGRRAAPLAKDETGARRSVVDRPKGVRRISAMMEPEPD